ncbi:MAG: methylenetetrahydrofolate--tRNA-(uracil(54)-C(5))-methyltransferase (FADH(2)-oxidizing) TrmFO [Alphaproteobacteria bacterium]
MIKHIDIIGGGLAGSEAAWQLAQRGIKVRLHEMRPIVTTPAHQTEGLAELVCSNSFRSDDWEYNAVGLLHEEMRRCNSLIMQAADQHKLPAGGALAVDRDGFSATVTACLHNHPFIEIKRQEITTLPDCQRAIIATGPLTSDLLSQAIIARTGQENLAFFDAIAPIVYKESVDFSVAWFQSRYDKVGPAGTGADYINCPFTEEEYQRFITALLAAETTPFKEWEKNTPYFEGCLPIEVMAGRGIETLRFGPMKPVGLTDPRTGTRPHAVVQLRQDNVHGTLFNLVGFQTKMKYGAQTEVFRLIPGLEKAEFARLGGVHRNSFINSPQILDGFLRLKTEPRYSFAGQMTGCEGYVESASIGLLAGIFAWMECTHQPLNPPPIETALGALLGHVTGCYTTEKLAEEEGVRGFEQSEQEETQHFQPHNFQPMNINYGLFPPLANRKIKGRERKAAMSRRALERLEPWLAKISERQDAA